MIVLQKDAFHALHLASEAAGGMRSGAGDPWNGRCGCLLSLAAFLDGRDGRNDGAIYKAPTKHTPVTAALWEAFGVRSAAPIGVQSVWGASDSACGYGTPAISWTEFCARLSIVPSR